MSSDFKNLRAFVPSCETRKEDAKSSGDGPGPADESVNDEGAAGAGGVAGSYFGGGAQGKAVNIKGGLAPQCFHGSLKQPKRGWMSSLFPNRP